MPATPLLRRRPCQLLRLLLLGLLLLLVHHGILWGCCMDACNHLLRRRVRLLLWLLLQLCRLWLRRRPCLLLRLLLLLLGLLPLARGAVSAVMPAWPLRAKVIQFLANRAAKTKSGRRHGNELGKCGWVAWAKTLSLSLSLCLSLSLFTMLGPPSIGFRFIGKRL